MRTKLTKFLSVNAIPNLAIWVLKTWSFECGLLSFFPSCNHTEKSSSLRINLLEELYTSQDLNWMCHRHATKQDIILKSGDYDSSNFVPLFIRVGDRSVSGHGYSSRGFCTHTAKFCIFHIFHVLLKSFLISFMDTWTSLSCWIHF